VFPAGAWRAYGPGGVTVITDDARRFATGESIDGVPAPG
jgi:hypothetical protein